MDERITTLLVPQGAEYQMVCQGLQRASGIIPQVRALPVGPSPVAVVLRQWYSNQINQGIMPQILIMGLCGSLNPTLGVGDAVIYQSCLDGRQTLNVPQLTFHSPLTLSVAQRLGPAVTPVTGVMCDRIICRAAEKQHLAQHYSADVVDMEGFVALEILQSLGIPVGMVRVVSDDVAHDLPDLNAAITPSGTLQTLTMAWAMARQPRAAARLIRGSLKGLQVLKTITMALFTDPALSEP